jgi:hypothetical protein
MGNSYPDTSPRSSAFRGREASIAPRDRSYITGGRAKAGMNLFFPRFLFPSAWFHLACWMKSDAYSSPNTHRLASTRPVRPPSCTSSSSARLSPPFPPSVSAALTLLPHASPPEENKNISLHSPQSDIFSTLPHPLPTGFNVETVEYKNISFTVWDVGGQDKVRFAPR